MIPENYIYELVQRNDITDVIGGYVQLRHRGRTHTGLCPFHNEKTPSFVVYPETQSFYCFGCGAGGDVINFVKKINNLDYIEAVKLLATRAGMPLPEEDDKQGRLRTRIVSINKDVARFYHEYLNSDNGADARRYWRGRGLSDATIRRFGLGFAPNDFRLTGEHMRSLGYTDEELLEAGIIKRSEKGSLYDVFRNRVMVPIFDLRGNVIAFGGRNLGDEKPKYINSPETLLYKKSKAMFALNIAKKSPLRRYILCEGYMDVIAMHQAGFTTAVAACGTALTSEQIKLLSDYADEVVLCYDSDEAGQKATKRAISLFSQSPIKVSVLSLPDAKDPDEFIKRFGKERFEMLLDGSDNAIEYELSRAKSKYDIATQDGRIGYMRDAINLLAQGSTATERDVYAGRLAEETDITKQAILNQLEASIRARSKKNIKEREKRLLQEGIGAQINVPYSQGGDKMRGAAFAEQQLIAAILKTPETLELCADKLTKQHFISEDMARVYGMLLDRREQKQFIDLSSLSAELPEETVALLSRILAQNYDVAFARQDVELYIERIVNSRPESSFAAGKSPEELAQLMEKLRDKRR
ncbi:MAG: DNA primase [Oscillospiraceae bacterium]